MKYILWDVDGTLLDFLASEKAAIKSLFVKYGLGECTSDMIKEYSKINVKYWQALERGEMTKPQILIGRFREWFSLRGFDTTIAESFNSDYQLALGDTIVFCDGASEVLDSLKKKGYIQIAVTNGTKRAQEKKLHLSGLDEVFDYVYISEDVGIEKPNVGFFEAVICGVNIKDKSEMMIIGDSLTSDIKGGNNIGIKTCWYNPNSKGNDRGVTVDYEIKSLNEVLNIL